MLSNLPFERSHVAALAEAGVDVVLNMCEDSEYRPGPREVVEAALIEYDIVEDRTCLLADLGGHPLSLLDHSTRRIVQASTEGQNVVVHCRGGRERSATIAASVLIERHGLRVSEALAVVRAIAPQADPLSNQKRALAAWQAAR